MGKNYCKQKRPSSGSDSKKFKEIGFVLIVFGLISICAFFLPIQAWIVLLGIVFIVCGVKLLR
jgi:hypothetical protein